MSKEKQIEEMACAMCGQDDICGGVGIEKCNIYPDYQRKARRLYNAGYRKQSEGEWVAKTDYAGYGYYCSNCNAVFTGENAEWIAKEHHYCPKCGAKMRKEDEGK